MTREAIQHHIAKVYGCTPEYPWFKFKNYAVYRHSENRKWFLVVMDLPKRKFDIDEDGIIDVINIKCDPVLIGSLLSEKGFFPAYHMNKGTWLSVLLDGIVDSEQIKGLIDISFNLTSKKTKP